MIILRRYYSREVGTRRCRDRRETEDSGCDVIASLPARRSREVVAVSGWRLGTAERQLGQHAVLPLPQGGEGEVGGEPGPGGEGEENGDGEGEEERGETEEDDPEGAEGMGA